VRLDDRIYDFLQVSQFRRKVVDGGLRCLTHLLNEFVA